MNVKLVISEKVIKAALNGNGEMIIGQTEQFFPCNENDKTEPVIEFFINDIFNENDIMSILINKTESYCEELSTGYAVRGKQYILAQKKLKFRREGKSTL